VITVFLPAPALDVVHLVGEVVPGRIHRPRRVIRSAGGKGINLARAAITFGAETVVVAPLGGHFGALVAELAAGEGIRMAITPSATETRTCLTVADEAGALTEFYEPSAVTGAELRLAAGRLAETPDDGWTVVSGSFPPGADLDHLAEVLSGRKRVALDCHGAALESLIGDVAPALVKDQPVRGGATARERRRRARQRSGPRRARSHHRRRH
jgi:fructose-1-phosphate kinase PfkB-like protein